MPKKLTSLKSLTVDPSNLNLGTDRGRAMLDQSVRKYGGGRSVLVDAQGRIIAGNKSVESAIAAGLDMVLVKTRGDQLVVVQREDLDLVRDKKARNLALADNRVARSEERRVGKQSRSRG